MSKLARQLGLPSIPPALRPSRVMRAMEFPMRAPSTPKGVAPLPRRRTTGADYDTEWARSKPARMARAAIVDGPMRLAVAGLASPDRQGADRLLELEVTLKDERLRGVEETLATERARHAREAGVIKLLEQRNEEMAEAATRHSAELARERERNNLYEARLAEREEMMATAMEEVRAAELRGETREARLALLGEKSRTQGDEVRLRDERLGLLHTRLQLAHEQLAAAKAEGKLVLADLGDKTAVAERERSGAAALRARLEVAEERVRTRDEQQAILTKRLVTAREGLQVQLAMIDEEVAAAKLGMDAKDMQLELMLEEASGRERQAHAFMASVTAKLQKAHSLMGAKDELLASLGAKLHASVGNLKTHEESAGALRREAAKAKHDAEAAETRARADTPSAQVTVTMSCPAFQNEISTVSPSEPTTSTSNSPPAAVTFPNLASATGTHLLSSPSSAQPEEVTGASEITVKFTLSLTGSSRAPVLGTVRTAEEFAWRVRLLSKTA